MTRTNTAQWVRWVQTQQTQDKTPTTIRSLRSKYTQDGGANPAESITELTEKIRDHYDLTVEEKETWVTAFREALKGLVNKHIDTNEQDTVKIRALTGSYDGWLKNIKYNSGIDPETIAAFEDTVGDYDDLDIFLRHVTEYFDLEQLSSAEVL